MLRVGKNKECIVEKYTHRKHGGLSNIYFSDGKKGKVIQIKIKGRVGKQGSLSQSMREALNKYLQVQANKHVALAGVLEFIRKIKSHVQPDYSDIKIKYYDRNK